MKHGDPLSSTVTTFQMIILGLTYQLSSGGVGRGKDEGPFFFHHPEKRPIRSEGHILSRNMMTTDRVD